MSLVASTNIVNPRHIGYVGAIRSSGDASGDAWFTPPHVIERVRRILNGIHLDPFSSDEADKTVGAETYFTVKTNAFAQTWKARTVFMNPPYSRGLCAKAVGYFLAQYEAKNFRRGIVLVNNMTDTVWFHNLARIAQRRCDLKGRLAFVAVDGKRVSGNTRGQTIFLVSNHDLKVISRFDALMPQLGAVYGPANWRANT